MTAETPNIMDSIAYSISKHPKAALWVLLLLGSGLGGTGVFSLREVTAALTIGDTLERVQETLADMNRNIAANTRLIANTRCEVQADREGRDWKDCWIESPFTR
jgi:hypothetical protein